ncbi:peroxiredoxin [Microvirgula aerodenitrificans]|uniref:thioredoxin-dependent peroxiredoxin n=1 Tax=Microvirgula aerodenitrificans TaxID=57480 RepID=A0A2S0PB23_9NEIS|nr:peroxiredoxin [Microvirgula aerodenitrificans]AVY94561.1 peroxiredoxin [Microvirgula aerodenitrificans]
MSATPCPDFTLPSTGDASFTLSSAPKPLVLYFYPKDNTPGCSNEAAAFRDLYPAFRAAGAEVVGISRDSLKSHENFRTRFELPFALLSDSDETVCTLFDVIKMKNMYGKQVRGIERSTFLIGRDGAIAAEWRKVKVPGHAEQVLEAVKAL